MDAANIRKIIKILNRFCFKGTMCRKPWPVWNMKEFNLDTFKKVGFEVVVSGAPSGNNFAVLRVATPLTQGQPASV